MFNSPMWMGNGGQVSVVTLDLALSLRPSPLAQLGVWAGGSKTNDGEIKLMSKSKSKSKN
jgi:hypothetical protein